MELSDFVATIKAMTDADMRRVASDVHARSTSPADEVQWWRAHISIDQAIRSRRLSRSASLAAASVSHAVVAIAEAADIMLPDPMVTTVARSAADVARAIVAGHPAADALDYLLEGWRSVFTPSEVVQMPSRLPVPYQRGSDNSIAAFG